jgi:hypothetical protein
MNARTIPLLSVLNKGCSQALQNTGEAVAVLTTEGKPFSSWKLDIGSKHITVNGEPTLTEVAPSTTDKSAHMLLNITVPVATLSTEDINAINSAKAAFIAAEYSKASDPAKHFLYSKLNIASAQSVTVLKNSIKFNGVDGDLTFATDKNIKSGAPADHRITFENILTEEFLAEQEAVYNNHAAVR